MKIVCDSCSTKYSISDDKVRGKVFKIRCKKCSHIIVVRGAGEGPAAPAEAASDAVWHLVVEGDQVGPLTDVEVRARLARGEISSENYVWKEGFSDWLRLAEVPELAEASSAVPMGGELFSDSPAGGAARAGRLETGAGDSAIDQGAFSGAGSQQEVRAASKATVDRARAVAAAPAPEEDAFSLPAASPRANEGGDLFGMAPLAPHGDSGRIRSRSSNGSSGAVSPRHDGGRVENLTAQRSENSVLFSLSNLQSLAAPSASTKPSSPHTTEGSGLIDIRAMAASTLKGPSFSSGAMLFGSDSKMAADELPTFGAFSSAAPVLFPIPSSSGPPKWLFLLIGIAVLLVIAVGAAAFSILRKPMIVEQVAAPVAPVAAAPVAAAPAPARPLAEGELPPRDKPEATAADKTSDKAGGDKGGSKGPRHGGTAKTKKGSADSKGSDTKGEGSSSTAAAAPSEPEKAKPAKGSLDDLLEGALNGRKARPRGDDDAPSPKEKKGGGDSGGGSKEPLAKGAVVAGMNGVKGKVAACFNQFKVPGMAMVNVVISGSGKVTSATVTGKFAGTPTGSCVEGAVKTASFPPSEGLTTPYPFNLR
jgi:predicted Zn finger-like uncharacterized protein